MAKPMDEFPTYTSSISFDQRVHTFDHLPNSRYDFFWQEVQKVGVLLKLARYVVSKLCSLENARVRAAIGRLSGDHQRPSPTDGDAVAASDIPRRTIATETDRAEHKVEKTDTILAGLVIQYVRDHAPTTVVVLTDDQPARSGIENAVTAQGYTDSITVYGLADIIGDDPGDSLRLI